MRTGSLNGLVMRYRAFHLKVIVSNPDLLASVWNCHQMGG